MNAPAFSIGCPSFVIPAGWAENAAFLAALPDPPGHIELLLCELRDDLADMIPAAEVARLAELAATGGPAYCAHLPVDIDLSCDAGADAAIRKITALLRHVRSLNLQSLVLHIETRGAKPDAPALRAVREISAAANGIPLALENIEGQPVDFLDSLVATAPAARCVDIGHLWKDGHEPADILPRWLPQATHIHLHGLDPADLRRDHRALDGMAPAALDRAIGPLLAGGFGGAVTLEVFSFEQFQSSRRALRASIERCLACPST
jgi:sugar phosphate isomerase/epimerase